MKKLLINSLILLCISAASCSETSLNEGTEQGGATAEVPVAYPSDSLLIPLRPAGNYVNWQIISLGDSIALTTLNLADSTWECCYLNGSDSMQVLVDVSHVLKQASWHPFDYWHPLQDGRILCFKTLPPERFFLVEPSGAVSRLKFPLRFPNGGSFFRPWTSRMAPPLERRNQILLGWYDQSVRLADPVAERKRRYSQPAAAWWEISGDSLRFVEYAAGFDVASAEAGRSNYHHYPFWCENAAGQLLWSFAHDHQIYTAGGEGVVLHTAASPFVKNFEELDVARESDFSYLSGYLQRRSSYEGLLYNPWLDHYYRPVLHKAQLPEDGFQPNPLDRSWSLMILDSEFELLTELYFPNARKYYYTSLLPCPDGVLIPSSQSRADTIQLSLFTHHEPT